MEVRLAWQPPSASRFRDAEDFVLLRTANTKDWQGLTERQLVLAGGLAAL